MQYEEIPGQLTCSAAYGETQSEYYSAAPYSGADNQDISYDAHEKILEQQMSGVDMDELSELLDDARESSGGLLTDINLSEMTEKMLNGEQLFDGDIIIRNLMDLALYEIKAAVAVGIEIIAITIIMSLLKNMSDSFGRETVSSLGLLVGSSAIIALTIANLSHIYEAASNAIQTMTGTMEILIPIMIPIIIYMGGFTSGTVLNPVIMASIASFNVIMKRIVLPCLFAAAVFVLINSLTRRSYIGLLSKFVRNGATFIMGICVTIFAGIVAIQGFVTDSADSVLIESVRYSAGTFVPVVGGFAADSMDLVITCLSLIKNTLGVLGVVVIICLLTYPVIKIVAVAVIYKITAVITEPIGEKEITEGLNQVGTVMILFAVVVGLAGLMFLIFLTVILKISGGQ